MKETTAGQRLEASELPTPDLLALPAGALSSNGLVVQSCRARVVRSSKWRPILRYVITYSDEGMNIATRRVLIGKGYFRGDGASTFGFMRQLWSEGFDDNCLLTIPEPVAYVPELKLLLQGRAPGRSLYMYLDNPGAALELVRLPARWLAKLHNTNAVLAPVLRQEQEGEKFRAWRDVLTQLCPQFAPRISYLAAGLTAALGGLAGHEAVPTHGDFQPKNIYILRNRVTAIDFDRFALAHPARDLGHFVGQSMTMSYVRTGSFREIEPWNAAFLNEYARLASPAALSALPVFIVRTFLEVLYYKLFVRPVKDASFLPAWLDEAERWLDRAA